ncbi:MAG: hypothetical protein KJ025_05500, partial [Burkholderiales bacterium]|nr:hypothetical protein [Burkholderiales bacterium]
LTAPPPPARGGAPRHPAGAPPALGDLYSLLDYQAANAHIWPSMPSFRWWIRTHHAELVEKGALLELAGRLHVVGAAMGRVAIEIGKRAIAAR